MVLDFISTVLANPNLFDGRHETQFDDKRWIPIVTEDAVIKNFFVYSDGTHTYVSGVVDGTIKFIPTDPDIGIEDH